MLGLLVQGCAAQRAGEGALTFVCQGAGAVLFITKAQSTLLSKLQHTTEMQDSVIHTSASSTVLQQPIICPVLPSH